VDLQTVKSILGTFGINAQAVSEEARLDQDLGMDSREVIELCCALEEVTGVRLPDRAINRGATVREVLALLAGPADPPPVEVGLFEGMEAAFAHSFRLSAEMTCDAAVAYQALWEAQHWPRHLPHVRRIEVVYDDGRFQEFLMEVESERGLLRVRSVRQGSPSTGIRFFQPQPPAFLKHHAGGWLLRPLGPGRCALTALHCWNLPGATAHDAAESDRVRALLTDHARVAVETWKRALEGKGQGQGQ